ncbi:MAG: hypothetical protein LBS00_01160, partial [Synergistaceae bacterium]|nr:hypothetical protein [Synergistaceae bacterium]
YIVAGWSGSSDGDVTGHHRGLDYWIVKLSGSGGLKWEKSLGGSARDEAASIQETSDGGYIVAGSSYSNDGDVTGHHGSSGDYGTYDYWVVKLK